MNEKVLYGNVLKVTRDDSIEDIDGIFSQMSKFGFDTVVVWPAAFWWEEKKEGYPFNTGKEILKLAEKYKINIIMELAGQLSTMEYIPDFLMKKEYHPIDLGGKRIFAQDSFGFLNYFHPEVEELIVEHYKKAALAYKDYNSLLGYDVFNETMYRSFDEYTINDFRKWLKEKYGTIEKLNTVWERTYSDFNQIEYEEWKWMSVMPKADYYAYRKAAITRFMKPWCDAIKSVDDKHILIADNIHSQVTPCASYDRPQDDYSLRDVADKIGMSFYPKGVGGCMGSAMRWEQFDGYYSASNREGFYISEMQTHIQALFNNTTCVEPYELKLWCAEAYASGAEAIIYWMWRPFNTGLQTLGRGLVNYQGKPTKRIYIAQNIKEKILKHGKISPLKSKVAIMFEPLCDDFQRTYTSSYESDNDLYRNSVYGAYKAFYDQNVRCDIIREDELENYSTVILTNHTVLSQSTATKLKKFVENGGTVIADGRFAVVDEYAKAHKTIPAGSFNDMVGEIYFDTDDYCSKIITDFGEVSGYNGRQIHEITDGEVLAKFNDGEAAIVKRTSGKGSIITINTAVWYGYACTDDCSVLKLVNYFADTLNLRQIYGDNNLKLRISEDAENYYVFAFNYTEKAETTRFVLNVSGKETEIFVDVKPNDVEIVKIEK